MRGLYLIILLFFIASVSQAQSIEVIGDDTPVVGKIGDQLEKKVVIKNHSDRILSLLVREIETSIGSSQSTNFCLDKENCFNKEERLLKPIKVLPGATQTIFTSKLESGLAEGFSTVKYRIYDKYDLRNAVDYEVTYEVREQVAASLLYESALIAIEDGYPNPATEFVAFRYLIKDEDLEAKIVIHNVLGSIAGEYQLPVLERNIKIRTSDFNPGVYFYTLYLDNDGVITKKMIVRK